MIDGIREIHDLGLIHDNVKPENFRIHNNVVKIIDFRKSSPLYKNK